MTTSTASLETETSTIATTTPKMDLSHRAAAAPPPPPGKKTFQSLSTDVKTVIVEHVLRPSDLKNICLTTKELHEIAVRFLYRNVSLDLGSAQDTRLSAFLNPRNIGLKYIKQIRLYLAHVPDRCNQEQQAAFATRMLLEFLPENVLEEFRCGFAETWCPWRPFSADNLTLLYKKQKKMKWLEVMELDRPFAAELRKNTRLYEGLFEYARKLAIYPENRETMELSRFFVEKSSDLLEELIIHANFSPNDDHSPSRSDVPTRELNDSAVGPGLLTSTLFAHLLPFESCTPFKHLNSLRLHRTNLRYCADTWCKFVDFTRIEYLRLFHCTGADTLLGQLSRASCLPRKLCVLELQHRDNTENETLLALDSFLCLVSGLEDLVLDLQCVKSLPGAAGVARHGKTLELLSIHGSNDSINSLSGENSDAEELVYDTESFDKICKATSRLQQLSCAWPDRSLIRTPSDDWCAFEAAAASLRDLVTLQITTWPSNKPSTQLLPRSVYEQLLQSLATRLFEGFAKRTVRDTTPSSSSSTETVTAAPTLLAPSRFRLLAFGISEKIYEREDSKHQILYLRSTAIDAEGKNKIYAAPIGWCLRQFVEPRSEVLDSALGREARVPCRGERADEGRFGSFDVDDDVPVVTAWD